MPIVKYGSAPNRHASSQENVTIAQPSWMPRFFVLRFFVESQIRTDDNNAPVDPRISGVGFSRKYIEISELSSMARPIIATTGLVVLNDSASFI